VSLTAATSSVAASRLAEFPNLTAANLRFLIVHRAGVSDLGYNFHRRVEGVAAATGPPEVRWFLFN
jgi:hypothetical protein